MRVWLGMAIASGFVPPSTTEAPIFESTATGNDDQWVVVALKMSAESTVKWRLGNGVEKTIVGTTGALLRVNSRENNPLKITTDAHAKGVQWDLIAMDGVAP